MADSTPEQLKVPVVNITIVNGGALGQPTPRKDEWLDGIRELADLVNNTILEDGELMEELMDDSIGSMDMIRAAVGAMSDFKFAVKMNIGTQEVARYGARTIARITRAIDMYAKEHGAQEK